MNKGFKTYMDRVYAGDAQKAQTKDAVMEALAQRAPRMQRSTAKKRTKLGKLGVGIAAAAACMVVAVTGYAYYETPVEYISLDINPSVELGVNAFQKVVRAQGINQDGADLIGNLNLHNMSVEDAVRVLVSQACTQEYIASDGSSVIALTTLARTAEQAMALGEQSEQGAEIALQQQNAFAILYGDTAELAIRTQAQQMGVSAGKYQLMLALQAMDPSMDMNQFKNMTVSQIMLKAGELAGSAQQAGPFAQTLQNMQQTATQVQQRSGDLQQDRDRLQDQDQTQDQDQLKTQDQLKDQDRLRDQDGPQASCEPTGYVEQNQGEGGAQQEQNDPSPTGSPTGSPQTQQQEEPSGSQGAGGGNNQ